MLAHCRAGLDDLAQHRAALGAMELRALASGHGVELGSLGLELLLRRGSAARVLEWMERTRSAALLAAAAPAGEQARAELAELASVRAEINLVTQGSAGTPPGELDRLSAAEQRVRKAAWLREGSGAADDAAGVPAIRASLGDRTLVSYGESGGRLFAVVLRGARRARLVWLDAPEEKVRFEGNALLFALRRMSLRRMTRRVGPAAAVARTNAGHALAALTQMLLRPLGVGEEEPLVVVPSASTFRLPWSALCRGPVSVAPSASAWVRTSGPPTRRSGPAGRPGRVLVVAGPGLAGADPEAEAVAARHPDATLLRGQDAAVATVVDALGEADLAHLACHGTLRGDNPTFSALELADGPLTVHELDARGIAPRRVVLAACDSAADVAYDGGELLGFVSALLARGTAGLAASVVTVGDIAAVALMSALHERLAGGAPMADALFAARTGLDTTDPRAFVNWCAFTAYGAG